MATPAPFKLVNPSFLLGTGTPVEIKCSARSMRHTIDYDVTDDSTFCEPGAEGVGKITETIEVDALQSFGAEGLWNLLAPLQLTVVAFELFSIAATVAVTSPKMTGTCLVPPIPFLDAGIRENSELTLVFKIRTGGFASIVTA